MHSLSPECFSNISIKPKRVLELQRNRPTSSIVQATDIHSKATPISKCLYSSRRRPSTLNSIWPLARSLQHHMH
jgi:hypothetical protein